MAATKRAMDQHWRDRLGRTELSRLTPQFVLCWFLIWEMFNSLADLHSLALEDILHEQGHNHSKADYYTEHLFLRILCHSLDLGSSSSQNSGSDMRSKLQDKPASEFPVGLDADMAVMEEGHLNRSPSDSIMLSESSDSRNGSSKPPILNAQNGHSLPTSKTRIYNRSHLRSAELKRRFGNLAGSGGLGSVRTSVQ